MSTSMMEVPESQRLIAVSLGKIAASRGQKGGINLHKNLLVATVLHKARTAYMIQHINAAKQRVAPTPAPTPVPQCVEMKEQNVSEPSSPASSPSPSPSPAPPTFQTAPSSPAAAPHSVTGVAALPETGSVPDGADVGGSAQVAECEDKENTPPPPSLPLRDATSTPATTTTSPECEKRLHEQAMDTGKDVKDTKLSRSAMSHAQQPSNNSTRDYVSGGKSCSSCLLKRRRAMDRDHENVSAPKVRIVESRVSVSNTDSSNQEAMQCDSPQISNLVNIFNTGFSGLSSVSSHKLSENLTCAKEMKFGLDSVHQPIVLSV